MIEAANASLLHRTSYSRDLNPIENAFANLTINGLIAAWSAQTTSLWRVCVMPTARCASS
jgi:hypothetical protein